MEYAGVLRGSLCKAVPVEPQTQPPGGTLPRSMHRTQLAGVMKNCSLFRLLVDDRWHAARSFHLIALRLQNRLLRHKQRLYSSNRCHIRYLHVPPRSGDTAKLARAGSRHSGPCNRCQTYRLGPCSNLLFSVHHCVRFRLRRRSGLASPPCPKPTLDLPPTGAVPSHPRWSIDPPSFTAYESCR